MASFTACTADNDDRADTRLDDQPATAYALLAGYWDHPIERVEEAAAFVYERPAYRTVFDQFFD